MPCPRHGLVANGTGVQTELRVLSWTAEPDSLDQNPGNLPLSFSFLQGKQDKDSTHLLPLS